MENNNKSYVFLFKGVSPSTLGIFRILFGLLTMYEVIGLFSKGMIETYYIEPQFHFTYPFLSFIQPWPGNGMYYHFAFLFLMAFFVTIGFFYRYAAIGLFMSYSYIFLLDKAVYNNHYYLQCLLYFLLAVSSAHHWGSVDSWFRPQLRNKLIPFWQVFLFRAQIFIIYFYAGIAKIDSDWLSGQTIRTILSPKGEYFFIGPFVQSDWFIYCVSYGGLIFDLAIGFLLIKNSTRLMAFLGIVFFSVMNAIIFNIGIFPHLCIASVVLFCSPNLGQRWFKKGREASETKFSYNSFIMVGVTVFLCLQILIPFRHWLYPGPVNWTLEGQRFSWRQKVLHRHGKLKFYLWNEETKEREKINRNFGLNYRQVILMSSQPDMIWQYVQFLKRYFIREGMDKPIIYVDCKVAVNGRKHIQFIDPNVNLAEAEYHPFLSSKWILPY